MDQSSHVTYLEDDCKLFSEMILVSFHQRIIAERLRTVLMMLINPEPFNNLPIASPALRPAHSGTARLACLQNDPFWKADSVCS